MKRPLFVVGQAEPIGYEEVPDLRPEMNGTIVDCDATAIIRKQFFDAYLRAGFNSEQALELTKLVKF